MRRIFSHCILGAFLAGLLIVPQFVRAQESHPGVPPALADGHAAFHHNHASFFSGGTKGLDKKMEGSHVHYTLGLDYERRLLKALGVAMFGEFVTGVDEEFLVGLQPVFHPYKGAKCYVGSLMLRAHEHVDLNGHTVETKTWHNFYGFRLGAAYDFFLGEYAVLTPELNYDRLGNHSAVICGVAFGLGF